MVDRMAHAFATGRIALGLLLLIGGCAGNRSAPSVFEVATDDHERAMAYVIDPPDEIVTHAFHIKEVDGFRQTVASDGTVTFPLVGKVKLGGMHFQQAEWAVNDIAARYYLNPSIKLELIAKSKYFSVIGRGARVKTCSYSGKETVLSVLREWVPPGETDSAFQVILVRPARDGKEGARTLIEPRKMTSGGDLSQNYWIEEGDIMNCREQRPSQYHFAGEGPTTRPATRRSETRLEREQEIIERANQRGLRGPRYLD